MLTERWKAVLCVAWRGNQLSKDRALFSVTQPSGNIVGWDPSGSFFPGPQVLAHLLWESMSTFS